MTYTAKVTVCSEINTKHSTQGERHVEFLNVKPGGTVNKPVGFKYCSGSEKRGKEYRTMKRFRYCAI